MLTSALARLRGTSLAAELARGAASAFAINVAALALGLLAQLVLARTLGPASYGTYAFVVAWVNILALVATLGLGQALLRFVAAYRAGQEWGLLRGVVRYADTRIALASGLIVAVGGAALWLLGDRLSPELALTFLVGLLVVPPLAMVQARTSTARALGRVALALLPNAVVRNATVIALIGIAAVTLSVTIDAAWAMAAMLVGTILSFALLNLSVWRVWPRDATTAAPLTRNREWRQAAVPMLATGGAQQLLKSIDLLILGLLLQPSEVGIYAIAARTAETITFGSMALNTIFAPTISALFWRGDLGGLQGIMKRASWWIFWSTALPAVALFVLAEPVLTLFGPQFPAGASVLRLLLVGYVLSAAAGPVVYVMTMTGLEGQAALVFGAALAVNAVAIPILVWAFGIEGAAIGKAASGIARSCLMIFLVWRGIGILPGVVASARRRYEGSR